MHCPVCNRETTRSGNPYRPFCSERCKLIDLSHWLSERYRIASEVETAEPPGGSSGKQQVAKEKRG
jgi:hypothetical protein